jgi:tRNA nucleotidyltransferase/poly(A) polymerase
MKTPPSLSSEDWLNDPALRRIFDALEAAGGEARVAGGAVRNTLMGEAVNDIDIATTLTPERIMKAGEKAGSGCIRPASITAPSLWSSAAGRSR